jgi:Quinohemoprotein amine dehydrogenase, alpha subunit domain III
VLLTGDWWEATDYMLHRKLVCLGTVSPGTGPDGKPRLIRSEDTGTSCAIGRILSFEPPSSKSFPDTIDNDFSFNIALRPAGLSDNPFVDPGWRTLPDPLQAVRDGYQGEFLREQDTPNPHEAQDGPRYGGYTSEMFFDSARNESGASAVVVATRYVWFLDGTVKFYGVSAGGAYSVPVLHCECEGSRIHDVFNVADQMPGGGSGCKKHWYTWIACAILRVIFFPFTTTYVAEAWANARDGDYHDALTGSGDLSIGDLVVVRGRWAYDAGHKGHNEIHAVATIQKIPDTKDRPAEPPPGPLEDFDRFYRDWCGLASEVPPDHGPGVRPADMTPAQTAVYDNQQKPENGYTIHPDVDGCVPRRTLVVRAVEPRSVQRADGDREVRMTGAGFVNGATVAVLGPDVAVANVVYQNEFELKVTLALRHDTPTGPRRVVVTNPDGNSGSCDRCLVITDEIIH